mgnify:CR=1 FL=1
MEGRLRTTVFESKRREKGNTWASSRRLVFVGRLHTSATSPLMKASRNGSKQAPAPVPAPGSKGRARGSQKGVPGHHFELQLYHKLPIHRPQRPLLVPIQYKRNKHLPMVSVNKSCVSMHPIRRGYLVEKGMAQLPVGSMSCERNASVGTKIERKGCM